MQADIVHQLQRLRQGYTPIEQHEHTFNMIAHPLLRVPQYAPTLIRFYIDSLNDDLRRAVQDQLFDSLLAVQQAARTLARKFQSMDAFNTLYTLRQGNRSIHELNHEMDVLLRLLEVPMADDLLQDLYRKSIRRDVLQALGDQEFASFNDLRRAVARISA